MILFTLSQSSFYLCLASLLAGRVLAGIDERVVKVLAQKYGYLPASVKHLASFVKVIHNFASYLGSSKYYSDAINKKIALLALDSDILALKAEKARLQADGFYAKVEMALLTKGKSELDKKEVEKFKSEFDALTAEALQANERARKLMEEIKKEYGGAGS